MKRVLILIIIAFVAILSSHAQVVSWSVKPGVYTKIEPCWENMYLVYKGNNVGVINGDGKIIVEPEATRITGFYEGFALALKSDGGKERIMGILSTDGSYSKVDGTYFAIPYQEFFSDGLLTVTNSRGNAGYINPDGAIVKEFKVPFVAPFSEGYAAVGEGKDFTLIDKRFNVISIQLGTVSQVYGGSNVYNGIAVIWDGDGKFYNFDVRQRTCKKISKPSSLNYDYMYCFSCITKRPENVLYEQPKRSSVTLVTKEQGGKYGYTNNGNMVVPYQFEQAENFYGKNAIVKSNGEYALLAYNNTNMTFSANATPSNITYVSSNKSLKHKFNLSIPSSLDKNDINIKLRDEMGNLINISDARDSYEFTSNGTAGTKIYTVEIEVDGIKLWEGDIAYNYVKEQPKPEPKPDEPKIKDKPSQKLSVKLKKGDTKADKDNHCSVKATISNPNSTNVETTVRWSGSNLLVGSSTKVTVPANGTKTVTIQLNVTKAVTVPKVTVTTDAGGSDTIEGLQLIPF